TRSWGRASTVVLRWRWPGGFSTRRRTQEGRGSTRAGELFEPDRNRSKAKGKRQKAKVKRNSAPIAPCSVTACDWVWCLLPFAFCLLPFAFCLLPFVFFLLPSPSPRN